MARFTRWFITRELVGQGWPQSRGFLGRRQYVDAQAWDAAVESAAQVCVGLGAGRPETAVRMLVDIFAPDAWEAEPAHDLLGALLEEAEQTVEGGDEDSPWQALYAEHRMALYGPDVKWDTLVDPKLSLVLADISAKSLVWGLTHEGKMASVYEQAKRCGSSPGAPITAASSLEEFYQTCERLVGLFEGETRPLPSDVPEYVSRVPMIARRRY